MSILSISDRNSGEIDTLELMISVHVDLYIKKIFRNSIHHRSPVYRSQDMRICFDSVYEAENDEYMWPPDGEVSCCFD